VFGPDVVLAFSRVTFALHQAEEVTVYDDSCTLRLCRVQVPFEQVAVAFGIIPMKVADEQ
jgi:hypothetical protein